MIYCTLIRPEMTQDGVWFRNEYRERWHSRGSPSAASVLFQLNVNAVFPRLNINNVDSLRRILILSVTEERTVSYTSFL